MRKEEAGEDESRNSQNHSESYTISKWLFRQCQPELIMLAGAGVSADLHAPTCSRPSLEASSVESPGMLVACNVRLGLQSKKAERARGNQRDCTRGLEGVVVGQIRALALPFWSCFF